MADNKDTTTVQTQDINLDELLGTPGAENIMVPTSKENKPSVFTRASEVDIDKLLEKTDDEKTDSTEEGKADAAKTTTATQEKEEIENLLNIPGDDSKNEESVISVVLANFVIQFVVPVPVILETGATVG